MRYQGAELETGAGVDADADGGVDADADADTDIYAEGCGDRNLGPSPKRKQVSPG